MDQHRLQKILQPGDRQSELVLSEQGSARKWRRYLPNTTGETKEKKRPTRLTTRVPEKTIISQMPDGKKDHTFLPLEVFPQQAAAGFVRIEGEQLTEGRLAAAGECMEIVVKTFRNGFAEQLRRQQKGEDEALNPDEVSRADAKELMEAVDSNAYNVYKHIPDKPELSMAFVSTYTDPETSMRYATVMHQGNACIVEATADDMGVHVRTLAHPDCMYEQDRSEIATPLGMKGGMYALRTLEVSEDSRFFIFHGTDSEMYESAVRKAYERADEDTSQRVIARHLGSILHDLQSGSDGEASAATNLSILSTREVSNKRGYQRGLEKIKDGLRTAVAGEVLGLLGVQEPDARDEMLGIARRYQ